MNDSWKNERLSWGVFAIGILIELLIGVGGVAAGWMLLKRNLLLELVADLSWESIGLGSSLGALAAVSLWAAIRLIPPLQRSRSLRILEIIHRSHWLQVIGLCLAAGLAEEILFRGCLVEVIDIWPAAVLFGLLHAWGRLYVFVAIGAGAALGYLYVHTGSLAAVIAAHTVYNLIISLLVKQGLFPLVEQDETENGPG